MKFGRILAVSVFFTVFCVASLAFSGEANISALKKEAGKAVPAGFQLVSEEMEDGVASVAYQKNDMAFQFTLSGDMDAQAPEAVSTTYKGKKAYFFEPGIPSAGAMMVILENGGKSIVVMYMAGFTSDEEVTEKQMAGILDKMDLNKLK